MRLILLSVLILVGCREPSYYANKSNAFKAKAIERGYEYPKKVDTTFIEKTDTVIKIVDNEVIKEITKTIEIHIIDTVYEKRPLTRQERKAYRDSINGELKRYKLENERLRDEQKAAKVNGRQENRKASQEDKTAVKLKRADGLPWWVWVVYLLILVFGVALGMVLKTIINFFKNFFRPKT